MSTGRGSEIGSASTALASPAPITITGGRGRLGVLHAFVKTLCDELQVSDEIHFALKLAAEEAFTNIVIHGYGTEAPDAPVGLEAFASETEIALVLVDQGRAFDPETIPPADVKSEWDERPIGGVGWHLIRQLTDRVIYEPDTPAGNRLTLVKQYAG